MINNPAGFWIRLGATILDGLIVSLPLAFIAYLMTGEFEDNMLTGTINMVYPILLPVLWYGYTVGKRIVGIRIVKVNGEKLGIGAMLLRNIVAGLVYLVTLGIGIIVSAFMVGLREDKRSLHDMIAGTYVTYDEPGTIIEEI